MEAFVSATMQMGAACMSGACANGKCNYLAQQQTGKQQCCDSCAYLSAWALARALRHQSQTGLLLSAPWLPLWTVQQRLLV
jgi:hypothetical protein